MFGGPQFEKRWSRHLVKMCYYCVNRNTSVGIAIRYRLDGQGIESVGGGADFTHRSRWALGPTQPLVKRSAGLFPGVKLPGHCVDHPPHLASRLKKE